MRIAQIVVDSNVFISAALAIKSGHANSPSATLFSKGLSPEYILEFVVLLAAAVEIVSIRGLDMGCRDERDNMFIETAVNGRVDALVTRDRDLQDAQTRYDLSKRNCHVLDVSQLLDILRNTAAPLKTKAKSEALSIET